MKRLFVLLIAALFVQSGFGKVSSKQAGSAWMGEGGVIVEIAPAGGRLLADLCRDKPNRLAHGLLRSEEDVAELRRELSESGLHGQVTASIWDGETLPFIENFVNLLICPADASASRQEIMRVLAPGGVALIGDQKIVKARPDDIDDWPQYLYDETGNAVSKDRALKPPLGHIQWVGGPRWSRHHETMSSISACVSGDNKVFYIFDEGNTFSPMLPSRWKLIARDAFNGVILWKRDIPKWTPNLHQLKSGPSSLPRRVVVVGKRLYVTLGIEAPVSELDTATGVTLRELEGTAGTEEIVWDGNSSLYLVADRSQEKKELQIYPKTPSTKWIIRPKHIMRFDLDGDKPVWDKEFEWVAPLTLAGQRSKLYFFDGGVVQALDKLTGEGIWKSAEMPVCENMQTFFAPKLVVQDGSVLFAGGEDFKPGGSRGQLQGLSMESGKTMWAAPNPASGYRSPEDLFVIDGHAWAGDTYNHRWFGKETDGTGEFTGVNLSSGKVDKKFGHVEAYWFHHRCHMAKATEDFLITCRTGTEFIDPKTGSWTLHHWIRGACLYGIMPANGMIYAPQHPCACYIGAKMFGFTTVAPKNPQSLTLKSTPEDQRLRASASTTPLADAGRKADEWPTYRGDIKRSGSGALVKGASAVKWTLDLGGKTTQPVIKDGKIVLSMKDSYAVLSVDAKSGRELWRYLPGARVDSPPALYGNRVYFGSADGYVNCLSLETGRLLWQYQAAPSPARHMYFERLESVHPVHGNVLVMDNKVYTVAGRSMFTDGGMRFLILDADTGRKINEHIMNEKVPGSDEELQMQQEVLNMPQALPDLLSSNGKKIFMRYQEFDLDGKRTRIDYTRKLYGKVQQDIKDAHDNAYNDQKGEDAHLFSATGFLDESWWHRTYWVFGKHQASGWAGHTSTGAGGTPSGRIMSFDRDRIYVWGRLRRYFKWTPIYQYSLQSCDYDHNRDWEKMMPILLRAMVLDDEQIYIAGPDEVARQPDARNTITQADTQKLMLEQEMKLNGRDGAKLLRIDRKTGDIIAGVQLQAMPAFDGMVSAYGNLYISTQDGKIQCLGDDGEKLPEIAASKIAEYNKNSVVPAPPPKKKKK